MVVVGGSNDNNIVWRYQIALNWKSESMMKSNSRRNRSRNGGLIESIEETKDNEASLLLGVDESTSSQARV